MKWILIKLIALSIFMSTMVQGKDKLSAETLLNQMRKASYNLNYELSYILVKKNSIEPFMFRHSHLGDMTLSHLIYLSGPMREVIRRNEEITYLEVGSNPFSSRTEEIVAPVIPLLHKQLTQLNQYYDFILMGRGREAGSSTQIIRIVPKDGNRYSYIVWIDERSYLPLRTDLISRDGEIIEQYRVVSYAVDDQIATFMNKGLATAELPEVTVIASSAPDKSTWHANWLPSGFKAINFNRYRLAMNQRTVERQMYSDGLFNFSIYISEADKLSNNNQSIRQGRRTLYSYLNEDYEINVVGDIPIATARRIAKSVVFSTSIANDEDK